MKIPIIGNSMIIKTERGFPMKHLLILILLFAVVSINCDVITPLESSPMKTEVFTVEAGNGFFTVPRISVATDEIPIIQIHRFLDDENAPNDLRPYIGYKISSNQILIPRNASQTFRYSLTLR